MPFSFTRTAIHGATIVEPRVFSDARGFFMETYRQSDFAAAGIPDDFVQENQSKSVRGTLRGLHAQRAPKSQGKLVQAIEGEIFDVAVDARLGSPSFGKWIGIMLSDANRRSVYVPPGCLHGFCVMSREARVIYRTTVEYEPSLEFGVRWDDPLLSIAWPVADPVLSARDQRWPSFAELFLGGLERIATQPSLR